MRLYLKLKSNYFNVFLLLSLLLMCIACQNEGKNQEHDQAHHQEMTHPQQSSLEPEQTKETLDMVRELKRLVEDGDPMSYYHWNRKQASIYEYQMNSGPQEQGLNAWYMYCLQLLNAGESRQSVIQLERVLKQFNQPYDQLLTIEYKPVFELLALAYLRLGEQENCQANHTPYSCIVPIQEEAFHQLKEGSTRAIELYRMLDSKFPSDKYKWLINLAYMTLGTYPSGVSISEQIRFPNWSIEQQNFPAFKDVAMNVNAAIDGLSGGACVDDFNGDGLMDIFTTSYGMSDQVQLLINNGEGGFENKTMEAGLKGIVSGLNCMHMDYNNDGFNDIFILRGAWLGAAGVHPNSLLRNNGDGTFDDVTKSSGLLSYFPTQTAAWADVNKDGWLDLFIGNERQQTDEIVCEFYLNNGDGTFKESAADVGLDGISAFVKGVTFGDINNDGWPDLYISVLGGTNKLYKNVNGSYIDISKSAGVEAPIYSFPCWFWDVNNDGFDDLLVNSYDDRNRLNVADDYSKEVQGKMVHSEKTKLYINRGDETFDEASEQYGIAISVYGMGANFGDLDNDGWLDFYIGTGAPDFSSIIPNRMFRNKGGMQFEEVTSAGGVGHIQKGHGIAFADLDQDGDQDIYAVMGGAFEGDNFTNVLFENPISKNNFIILELVGTATNRAAIGSKLELTLDDGRKIYRTIGTGGTFGSSNLQEEIGIGTSKRVTQLTIWWQNGKMERFSDIEINRKYKIQEGKGNIEEMTYEAIPFAMSSGSHHHHHH